MNNGIAIVSDMIFASRIAGTAEKLGATCKIIKDADTLQDALESEKPDTVFVDMSCDSISPEAAIRTVKTHHPNARVVAFYSHVQTELAEQAKAAGADDVLPRSAFVQQLPGLLATSDRSN